MTARLPGHSLHLDSQKAFTDRGSGYANVVLLLLRNLEDAWDTDVNSAYVTELAYRAGR